MLRRLLLAALVALPFSLLLARAAGPSEDEKTRLSKQEVIDLMIQVGRMPRAQQESKMDLVSKDQSGSKTPRSDFLFCTGLGYLGNYRAQACVGNAFEKGLGIVEDLTEAYGWYGLALESHIADKEAEQRIQDSQMRVLQKLRSSYPSPSDDDLDDLVREQKSRVAQYQEEIKKAKK